jgi:hypothetical protein
VVALVILVEFTGVVIATIVPLEEEAQANKVRKRTKRETAVAKAMVVKAWILTLRGQPYVTRLAVAEEAVLVMRVTVPILLSSLVQHGAVWVTMAVLVMALVV